MQRLINLNIERFQEKGQSYFVATSPNVQGLVAEADTLEDVITIASDLIPILLELNEKDSDLPISIIPANTFQIPLIIAS